MKTAIFSLIGAILAIVYMVFLAPITIFSLLLLPLSWITAVWMLHGLSRAYIVALFVGILLDLHYYNFGLLTLIILVSLSLVYFVHITVISSTNAASTLILGLLLPLIVCLLLWVSLGLSNGFHYYNFSWSFITLIIISSLSLSALTSGYCWIFRRIKN